MGYPPRLAVMNADDDSDTPPRRRLRPEIAFLLKFALYLVVFFVVTAPKPMNDAFVEPFTTAVAKVGGFTAGLFGEDVKMVGTAIISPRFAVNVRTGCNGLETIYIFFAGVLAFPAPWSRKLWGLLLGFLAIQLLNNVRSSSSSASPCSSSGPTAMQDRLDPRIKKLLVRLPLSAVLAILLWFVVLNHPWGGLVTRAGEWWIRAAERTKVTRLAFDDGLVVVERADLSTRSEIPAFSAAPITANLVLLLALLFATPPALRGTAFPARAAAAFGALLLTQVLHLSFTVQTLYAMQLGAWSAASWPRWQREVVATGRYFFDIIGKYAVPFIFWAITLRLGEEEEEAAKPNAAPAKGRRRKKKG